MLNIKKGWVYILRNVHNKVKSLSAYEDCLRFLVPDIPLSCEQKEVHENKSNKANLPFKINFLGLSIVLSVCFYF